MVSRTLIIGASAVYRVALIQYSGSALVVTHCKEDVRVKSGRPITLGLVPFSFSTSISVIYAATDVVNAYVY